MKLGLTCYIEGLERMEHDKSVDPFLFVALQRAFFDGAIQLLEQNSTPESKKSILKQLNEFEKTRDRITPLVTHNPPTLTQFQIQILDSMMQECIKSYNQMQILLKNPKRKTKSRMYV